MAAMEQTIGGVHKRYDFKRVGNTYQAIYTDNTGSTCFYGSLKEMTDFVVELMNIGYKEVKE